ncbi:MAG: lytic murein transglycosylase [Thiotrichaceae bacterium]|nr:lytic murein transglycosylase [Thiotrichaceae bacterium]
MNNLFYFSKVTLITVALSFVLVTAHANSTKNYPVAAKNCRTTQAFPQWLANFKQLALRKGIQQQTINEALDRLSVDHKVIQMDRGQAVFTQDFLTFSNRMVNNNRLQRGKIKIRQNARIFNQIKQQYGIPAPIITAFWGLETDFGANTGNMSTMRSLATLAWDCRRSALFTDQLLSALKIIDRGDLTLAQMRGAWAGELGQTQFLPSEYYTKGVDFDRDGKVDMIRSSGDALASTAKILKSMGWRKGQPWLVEVKMPNNLPWQKSGIDQHYPAKFWSQLGVKQRNGRALTHTHLGSSLLLPMGRNGPAFIAYPNFYNVYFEWNSSVVYATTAAYFATRLAGAPRVHAGQQRVNKLSVQEVKRLQIKLESLRFNVGDVDGIIGAKTRKAVRTMQQRLQLPADSYPDRAFYTKVMQTR